MMFETEAGIGLMHFQMRDLEPSVWIGAGLIIRNGGTLMRHYYATVGNSVDCDVFAMRHMDTWFGVTTEIWDSKFPLINKDKKA
ncbi:hypothetical protein Hanom_Chr14g01295411 [Helianthus anomalus]